MAHNYRDDLPFAIGGCASMGLQVSAFSGDGTRVAQVPSSTNNYGLYDMDGYAAGGGTIASTTIAPYPRFRPDLAGRIVVHPNRYNGTPPDLRPVTRRCVQVNMSSLFPIAGTAGPTTSTLCQAGGGAIGGPVSTTSTGSPWTSYGAVALPSASPATTTNTVAGPAGTSGQTNQGLSSQNRGCAVTFDVSHGRYGTVVMISSSTTMTNRYKPIDDQLSVVTSGPAGDWVYVVEEGPCSLPVINISSSTALTILPGTGLAGMNGSASVGGTTSNYWYPGCWYPTAQGSVISAIALTSLAIPCSTCGTGAAVKMTIGSVLAYVLPDIDTTETYG